MIKKNASRCEIMPLTANKQRKTQQNERVTANKQDIKNMLLSSGTEKSELLYSSTTSQL